MYGSPYRMAPHGVYSAASWSLDDDVIHHFTDGHHDWTIHTGFEYFADLAVSDRGETAALGYVDDVPTVRLFDVDGAVTWTAEVGPVSAGNGLEFAPTGDALAIREDSCLRVVTIAR